MTAEEIANSPLLSEWIDISESQDEKIQLLTQIYLTPEQKKEVYPQLALIPGLGILDRSYFTKWMLLDIKNNFNLILFISGSIVFLALLISCIVNCFSAIFIVNGLYYCVYKPIKKTRKFI